MRLRIVAPASAVTESGSDSISAFWPAASMAGSAAAARQSAAEPLELPLDRPDNGAAQVS